MFRKGLVFRLIGVVLLIGLLSAGGYMAYHAGVAQGISQAPEVASAIAKAAESGQGAPIPPMMYDDDFGFGRGHGHGYPYGFGGHHFGFFPIGGICFSIIFLFLFLGFMKMIFFRGMWWGHHGNRHGYPWGGPPWMRDQEGEEKKEGGSKEESKQE